MPSTRPPSPERLDGTWAVTSKRDTLSAEDLALGAKQQLRFEECRRTMKSGLELRPVQHHRPARIRAHVRFCALVPLIERLAEARCKDNWASRPG